MKVSTFFVEREVEDPQLFKAPAVADKSKGCYGVKDGETDDLLFWCGAKLSAHIESLKGDMKQILAFLLNCRVERQVDENGVSGNWVAMMPSDNAVSLGLDLDKLIEEERLKNERKRKRREQLGSDDDEKK